MLGLEAMRMLEQGVASAEDIDKAMELGYNHPMGPLKLTDQVGLDVRLAIAEYLHATLGKSHYEPPRILREKVKKGELGKKTGKGVLHLERVSRSALRAGEPPHSRSTSPNASADDESSLAVDGDSLGAAYPRRYGQGVPGLSIITAPVEP